MSDNVTYTVEQIGTVDASEYRYKLIFKPESILPIDIEFKAGEEGRQNSAVIESIEEDMSSQE